MVTGLFAAKRGSKKLALLKTFFLRSTGQWPRWGFDQENRAGQWLLFLEKPSSSLSWRVHFELLAFQSDLLMEEQAMFDDCLRLQIRVLELVDRYEVATEIRDLVLGGPSPMHHVIGAIVKQGQKEGATEVWTAFSKESADRFRQERGIPELPVDPGWDVARAAGLQRGPEALYFVGDHFMSGMGIPKNLSSPLRGAINRIATATQKRLLHKLVSPSIVPPGLVFDWISHDMIKITLKPATVEDLAADPA